MEVTVRDVIKVLEELAPLHLAESYDNAGLLVGHEDQTVERIMLSVDASESVLKQAAQLAADLLITHHPLIFHPLMHVTENDPVGSRVLYLAEHGIALYAAHTNMDAAPGGNIDYMAEKLGMTDVRPAAEEGEAAILRVGSFESGEAIKADNRLSLKDLAARVKETLNLPYVRVYGDPETVIQRAALCTGSGMSLWETALQAGAQAYITGDITYHRADDALRAGLSLIDCSHFMSDRLSVEHLFEYLSQIPEFAGITILKAEEQENYTYL